MAAQSLQPSEYEIQREVEALRDIRRRSTAPGALVIDPDLPNQSSPTSPTYWSLKSPTLKSATFSSRNTDNDSVGSSSEGSSSSDHSRNADGSSSTEPPNNSSDDPFHLFWVPASLHPEIAPTEFRAFLRDHARSPPDGLETLEGPPSPSSLSSSSSLNRKRSMLSRQYRPKLNDGVEEENVVPLKRNRSLLYPTNPGPQLTISDLQKLGELAEEAEAVDDPSRLRNLLRRSLTLNLSPSAIDLMDDIPDMGDEADAPIIIPPPGQILRRTARTKIRKPGLPGDGGGHRFGSSRRGGTKTALASELRSSSDMSTSDHSESDSTTGIIRQHTVSDDGSHNIPRPDSFSEEASIYDAYAQDDEDDTQFTPVLVTSPAAGGPLSLPVNDVPQLSPEVIPQRSPVGLILQQPQPQRVLVLPPAQVQGPFPAPGPSPSAPVPAQSPIVHSPPMSISTTPSPPLQARKEKDKKGLFGKWGGDKVGKKGSKVKDRENRVTAAEREKESGFFGSLFGKKKPDSEYSPSITGGTSGREAAQALLGASKSSKAYVPSTSPGLAPGVGGNPYARYPIHVERAIYRLSHIKLANPRRPLYEQVLISNLMFWYLGVINKAQNPSPSTQSETVEGASNENHDDKDAGEKEKEQKEREQVERAEKERLERERLEKEQREREFELRKKESTRKGSLTKMNAGTPLGGGRHAEMPIKGPQYEMQHRVIEQKYGPYNGQPPRGPTSLMNGPLVQQYSRSPTPPQYGNTGQLPPKAQPDPYYYQPRPEIYAQRPNLPPGAMAPVEQLSWMLQPSSPPQHRRRSPNPTNPADQRRSNSPPSHNQQGQENQLMQFPYLNTSQESLGDRHGLKNSGRSLSATAASPTFPPTNGYLRKGKSAHATLSHEPRPYSEVQPLTGPTSGEEEDLPLAAVWQRRRK